jgi:hypothetical protein
MTNGVGSFLQAYGSFVYLVEKSVYWNHMWWVD